MDKNVRTKLECQGILLACLCSLLHIEGKDKDNFYTLYCNGDAMEWTDYVSYNFPTSFKCENGEVITDALLFGDGTLEFVIASDDESVCWDDLSATDLTEISRHIESFT